MLIAGGVMCVDVHEIPSSDNICVVIVTYGDRFHLLKEVIASVISEGVKEIVVVDNNSADNSRKKLRELECELEGRLKVIYLPENTGSAGGYRRGLEEVLKCRECSFVWLLDDDNKPEQGALQKLIDFWIGLEEPHKEERVALFPFRRNKGLEGAVLRGDPKLVFGRRNSFMGFHILDFPERALRFLLRKLGVGFKSAPNGMYRTAMLVPYGGLFLYKRLLLKIGYPREDFFLYTDDYEWTYRIVEGGGKIYVVLDSNVRDMDTSWYLGGECRTVFCRLLNSGNDFRVYYTVRNRVYFETMKMVDSRFVYGLNRTIFNVLLTFFVNSCNRKRKRLFDRAVKDGLSGKLGKNDVLVCEDTIVQGR